MSGALFCNFNFTEFPFPSNQQNLMVCIHKILILQNSSKTLEHFSCWALMCQSEVQKVRQPGNLVARKFLKNQALAESFWILFPHFLAVKQFGGNRKGIILVFLQNGHILHSSTETFCLPWLSLLFHVS